jgi:hypothetical protein
MRKVPEREECPKFWPERGGVSYTNARKIKVLERHSSLHPSEKELLKRRSSTFRQKNTPGCSILS